MVLLLLSTGLHAQQGRVALVIGNGDYSSAPLKNPVNDAKSMTKTLTKLGFQVIEGTNLTRKQMRSKIREFGNAIKNAEVGLFYYAGHGMQSNGKNYLIPVQANIQAEDEIMDESINASSILRKMETAGNPINIVVLDACRNNPFKRSFRSVSRGLTRIEGPKGTLIAYATAPGSVAADGDGSNGLYTQYLIKYMLEPVPLEKVFKKVRMAVSDVTHDRQIPWESSSLVGEDFYFNTDRSVTNNNYSEQPIIQSVLPKTGNLIIRSNVNGDQVMINGEPKGSTKLDLELKPGVYVIEVSKKGYKTFEQSYNVVAGTEQILYAKLRKNRVDATNTISPKPSYRPTKKKKYTAEQQRAIDLFNQM